MSRESASGTSFYGNPMFGVEIEFPCTREEGITALELLESMSVGDSIPIRGVGASCENSIGITLRASCYSFIGNGIGGYRSTPLTSISGFQDRESVFQIESVEVSETEFGQTRLKLQANFSADLYYNTTAGEPIHFGLLDNAKVGIDLLVD
jgi:hypothetical protein